MAIRLKSLELQGYKTFASRTRFEFPGSITAIVGPNGSGKSNVADSIRWVLGEQSYSLLRARKTEDMIFSGSEQRPRAGMASVSITFDNEDGWLPVDFAEVSITRRAYRDGNNEYLLNGQRVRLREITELLGKSGLAERTYTIIGQGLVDAALSLKPEERRRLFEEAAGIGLYRGRREEAITRLENTKRNLDRVRDILAEIEPRLKHLEKQAKRVQEYQRIEADLRVLLREWYGYHWHVVQKELAHAKEVLRVQEARLGEARIRYERASERVSTVRASIQDLRARLNAGYAETSVLNSSREKVSREIAILEERQRSQVEQRNQLDIELARIEEEIVQESASLEALREEALMSEQAEAEAKTMREKALLDLRERQDVRSVKERELAKVRQVLVQAETRRVQISTKMDELSSRRIDLEKNLATAKTHLEKYGKQLEETGEKRDAAEKAVEQTQIEMKKQADALENRQGVLRELVKQSSDFAGRLSQLEREAGKLQAQLDVLEQAEKSLTGYTSGAKRIIEAVAKGKLSAGYVPIAQSMHVPEAYELAIGSALGDFIDSLAVNRGTDPEEGLRYVAEDTQSRTAFIPAEWIREFKPIETPEEPGFIGMANQLVQTPAQLAPIIDAVLGRVAVVRDRQAARRLVGMLPESVRIVTLQGEVFYPNGPVLVGREPRSTRLSQPRQRLEYQNTIAEITQKIKDLHSGWQEVEEQVAAQREDIVKLESNYRNYRNTFEAAQMELNKAQLEYAEGQRQYQWQQNQVKSIEGQIAKTIEELATLQKDLQNIEGEISQRVDETHKLRDVLNELPLDELQTQVNHWNTRNAVAEQGNRNMQSRLSERIQALERLKQRKSQSVERKQILEQHSTKMQEDHLTLRNEENHLVERLKVLQQKLSPDEESLKAAEKENRELEQQETAAQQSLTIAERYHAQAQVELAKQEEVLASLRRRVEDDFGLVSFEYAETVSGPTPLPLEGMVEQLPVVAELHPGLEENIARQKALLRRMGAINLDAEAEYREVLERYQFMTEQVEDLHKANADLENVIAELDDLMRREFRKTFEAVAQHFSGIFTRLFNGGHARLVLIEGETPVDTGIDIEARLPGRREQGLALLSGGERSLTAVALVFSLLKVSPTPFCVLDEVDAMLDESNVGRFRELLKELSQSSQFMVITHNRNTVQAADVIYGVTMGRDSASQVISLRLDEVPEEMITAS